MIQDTEKNEAKYAILKAVAKHFGGFMRHNTNTYYIRSKLICK